MELEIRQWQKAAKLLTQKKQVITFWSFHYYQQVVTIRLGMAEELISHFIPCYIIYTEHIVYLIDV